MNGFVVSRRWEREESPRIDHAPPARIETSLSGESILVWSGELYDELNLVEGLEREGPAFLERTDGAFALVLLRPRIGEVLVARDRIGLRPLYWAESREGWAVGTSVRDVLRTGIVPFELDPGALESYLTFGSVYEPHTIARGVHPVAPGTWRRQDGRGWREQTWWRLPEPTAEFDAAEAAEETRALLVDAIRRRYPAKGPLGVFASGGTDSSSLVILTSRACKLPVSTLSVAFVGDDVAFSEAPWQRRIAEHCQTDHHEIVLRMADALDALEDYFERMDQPAFDGMNLYFASRAAKRESIEVCFSGDGGDEVFAGYKTFESVSGYRRWIRRLARLPASARWAAGAGLGLGEGLFPLDSRITKTAHLLREVSDLAGYYALRRAIFTPGQTALLLGRTPRPAEELLSFVPSDHDDSVTLWSAFEIGNYTRNTHARDADVFAATSSVIRFPYLDHRVIETAFRVNGRSKLKRDRSEPKKPYLRAVLRGELPSFTWDRPKQGFTLPYQVWLQKRFVSDPDLSPWLDEREVTRVMRSFRSNPANGRSWGPVWLLVVLERCLRRGYP